MSQRKPKGYKLLENHTYQCAFWGQLRSDEKGGHEFVDFLRRRDFVPEIGLIVKWLRRGAAMSGSWGGCILSTRSWK